MKENKKILAFVCMSLDKMAGGLERQIIRTAKSLSDSGFKVILITYDNKSAESFYKVPKDIEWVKCGIGLSPHQGAPILRRLKQIFFLRKKLLFRKVTHLITFHHGLFPRSLLASLFLPIKNIVSERNSLNNYKYIKLSKFNLGFLSLIFANKITVQLDAYVDEYPKLFKNKIEVIPNFIKPPLPKSKNPALNSKKVLMLGRLCAQKNYSLILDQFKNIDSKPFEIKIAGEGELRTKFEYEYKDILDSNKVKLVGNIKDVDNFLLKGSIFCFPSLWEGYPNALVEALRVGLPIITTSRMANLSDFIEHNVNGLIVDDSKLFKALSYLIENENILKRMSYESKLKYYKLYFKSPKKLWNKLIDNL
ncbi:glycosyltransferase [Prochlorococcus marinus]|uniref:Glycosyl transferase, group 1 n=1 Tax=Prochlorococcus marinus (strain AS9601) TaxID=146891 RepID=A2BSB7_PROMS|nr:glycosyltransferase [Prochlorococcus marinus]ABM70678.1 Glycosyl transferase, group 1 [Prochlorococcus marinus str. AS9601]